MNTQITAIILAAGLSRRMGAENKLFLEVNGKPMVEQVIERVLASKAERVVIVTSELSHDRLLKFRGDRVEVVQNHRYQEGMTSSIQSGVATVSNAHYMICLGDQPTITTNTYNLLMGAFRDIEGNRGIVLPFYEGRKGNPVIFSNSYRDAILTHPEPEGCKELVQANKQHVVKVEVEDAGVLLDIDTREDYGNLRKK